MDKPNHHPILQAQTQLDIIEDDDGERPAVRCEIQWHDGEVDRLAEALNYDPSMFVETVASIGIGVARSAAEGVASLLIIKGIIAESDRKAITDKILLSAQDDHRMVNNRITKTKNQPRNNHHDTDRDRP